MCSALCGITELDQTPNSHIVAKISTAVNSNGEEQGEIDMKTGLDSHANMCVFGDDCLYLNGWDKLVLSIPSLHL